MKRIMQLILLIIAIVIFTGCGLTHKNLMLHENTLENFPPIKEVSLSVNIVNVQGDLANPLVYGFGVDKEDIKSALIDNLDNYYNVIEKNGIYQINCTMNFVHNLTFFDQEVKVIGKYNILQKQQVIATIEITSKYVAKIDFSLGEIIETVLVAGIHYKRTTDRLPNNTLYKSAYAIDDTIPLTAMSGNMRLNAAYSGAIRLNFAKFLQELIKSNLLN